MEKGKGSLEARKALEDLKVEISKELEASHEHIYDLRNNLTKPVPGQPELVKTKEKSRNNPNYSFSDFLGKGF